MHSDDFLLPKLFKSNVYNSEWGGKLGQKEVVSVESIVNKDQHQDNGNIFGNGYKRSIKFGQFYYLLYL